MTAPILMCRACREPIGDPDDAVHLGHEEGDSGPGRDIHAHHAHIDQAGLSFVAAVVPARTPG